MIWYVFGQINDMFISKSMNICEGPKQIITVLQIGCTCHTAPLKMIPQSFPPWDLLLPVNRKTRQTEGHSRIADALRENMLCRCQFNLPSG